MVDEDQELMACPVELLHTPQFGNPSSTPANEQAVEAFEELVAMLDKARPSEESD